MLTTAIGNLIDSNPRIRGGRPKIAGTGVTVQRIVSLYKSGLRPEEIAENFGHLSLAQVHAALAYYHANQEQIESDLAAQEAATEASSTNSAARSAARSVPCSPCSAS